VQDWEGINSIYLSIPIYIDLYLYLSISVYIYKSGTHQTSNPRGWTASKTPARNPYPVSAPDWEEVISIYSSIYKYIYIYLSLQIRHSADKYSAWWSSRESTTTEPTTVQDWEGINSIYLSIPICIDLYLYLYQSIYINQARTRQVVRVVEQPRKHQNRTHTQLWRQTEKEWIGRFLPVRRYRRGSPRYRRGPLRYRRGSPRYRQGPGVRGERVETEGDHVRVGDAGGELDVDETQRRASLEIHMEKGYLYTLSHSLSLSPSLSLPLSLSLYIYIYRVTTLNQEGTPQIPEGTPQIPAGNSRRAGWDRRGPCPRWGRGRGVGCGQNWVAREPVNTYGRG